MQESTEKELREPTARDIDVIYRATDKLYYQIARGCGLSECALWLLYAIVIAGGRSGQADLVSTYSYSRTTANSALKSLETKGIIELVYAEGSRKNKDAVLTDAGRTFCDRYIQPAVDAEGRAFASLEISERKELVRLIRKFSKAVAAEVAVVTGGEA